MILNALIVIQSVDNRVVGLDFRQPLEIAHFHLGDLGFDLVGPLLQLFADVLFTVRLILFYLVYPVFIRSSIKIKINDYLSATEVTLRQL